MYKLGITAFLFVFILLMPIGINLSNMFNDNVKQKVMMTSDLEEEEERGESNDCEDEREFLTHDLSFLIAQDKGKLFYSNIPLILIQVHNEVSTPPPEFS